MHKRSLRYWMTCVALGSILFLTGCDSSKNTLQQHTSASEESLNSGDTHSTEATPSVSEEPTQEITETSEVLPTESVPIIVLPSESETPEETPSAGPTAAKLEAVSNTYTNHTVSLAYPQIIGLKDTEMQEHANTLLYEHAMEILEHYVTDEEADFFQLDYELLTLYRGQISILYTGTYQGASDDDATHIRIADNINLIDGEIIRLSQRVSKNALKKIIFDTKEYEMISSYDGNQAALQEYLESQSEEFFDTLVENGDFGGTSYPSCFSYHNGDEVTIIIPMPHLFGDYLEIRIIQKSK